MNLVRPINHFFITPIEIADRARRRSLNETASCATGFAARFLFIAQIISSIVATSFFFLSTIITCMFFLCIDRPCSLIKQLGIAQIRHLALIPTAFISVFAPHSAQINWPFSSIIPFFLNREIATSSDDSFDT